MKEQVTVSKNIFILLLCGCVLSLFLSANFVRSVAAKESSDSDSYTFLKNFTDVLALVQKNYVHEVDIKSLVEGSVKGMLASLDPHSGYLPVDIYKELQVETKGKFGGLGIEITVKDGLLTVVSPIEESPAYKAGVLAGDQIIKIADEFAKNLSLVDAVKKMRGPKGTPITISVHREGYPELIPITIIRDIIKVKSIRSRQLGDDYGYVRLAQFQEGSAREFSAALKEIENSAAKGDDGGLKGLVIDLRNNPGGLLTQAIRVSDLFLKDGVIVYTDGRLESQKQKYFAHDDGVEPEYPIVVLVNSGSASASEIVAGALQDHGRALILGKRTFGKGSVQTILPMENGSALRLTTALYFTKSGRSIQAQGIEPDIAVAAKRFPKDTEELLEEDESSESLKGESQLPGALKNPSFDDDDTSDAKVESDRVLIGSRSAMKAELSKLLRDDPQLDEALRLLKTWHIFQGRPAVQAKKESNASTRT
ncbi:hypothetical protein BVY02_01160 [bacterium J17]|nr:hypothetical protein BVY02_01160 [bacterium J17]